MKKILLAAALLAASSTLASAEPTTFQLDKSHQFIGFEIGHFGYSKTIGRFNDVDGTFVIDEADPAKSEVDFTIQTASIDTQHEKRDGHLKSADFFDVEKFPTITFKSTAVELTGDNKGKITGDMTMLGETKPVTLDFVMVQDAPFPLPNYKNVRTLGFMAEGEIKRSDWGLDTFVGVPISDEVRLILNFDAVLCEGEAAEAPSCTFGR